MANTREAVEFRVRGSDADSKPIVNFWLEVDDSGDVLMYAQRGDACEIIILYIDHGTGDVYGGNSLPIDLGITVKNGRPVFRL